MEQTEMLQFQLSHNKSQTPRSRIPEHLDLDNQNTEYHTHTHSVLQQ